MIITPVSLIRHRNYNTKANIRAYNPPNEHDTVSFTAVKNPPLSPADRYCAQHYNTPAAKQEHKKDFDRWAKEQFYAKSDLNSYYSDFARDNIDRIYRLDIWKQNLKNNLYEKHPSLALLVWDSITAPLSRTNHEQPPIYNSAVLYRTIEYLVNEENLKNHNFAKTFKKVYENTLRHFAITGDTSVGKLDTTWIKIPSKISDKENFSKNLTKLKILSNHGWCTKATHAQAYLEEYDYYIYLQNGSPKLFVKTAGNDIKKIQCGVDSNIISYKYASEIRDFIDKEHLHAGRNEEKLLEEALSRKEKFQKLISELSESIKTNNQKEIFNKTGISVQQKKDGTLRISHYKQPDIGFTFKELGIDENLLLKNVSEIEGNADFMYSNATVLDDLKRIGKDANFMYSKIKSLKNLEVIGGIANFMQVNNLKSLPNLLYAGEKIAVSPDVALPVLKSTVKLYF